jgi:hypothetical protein
MGLECPGMHSRELRIFLVRTDASRLFLHSPPHQKKLKEKTAMAVGREKK